MSIITPGERIDAPACVPTRFGLLSVAEKDDRDTDKHWGAGFHHEELTCEEGETRKVECVFDPEKDLESSLSYPTSDPFTVVAPFKCATSKMTLAEAWNHAEKRLDRTEDRSVERTFWSGLDSQGNTISQTLGNGGPEDLTPLAGAVKIGDGVSLLEEWAGENLPCGPIIHARRGIGTYFAERGLVAANGEVLSMIGTGTRVALGGAYQNTGPLGVVPGGTFYTTVLDAMTACVLLDDCVDGIFVDWGDGNGPVAESCPVDPLDAICHTYDADDTYQITVTGPGGFHVGPVTVTTSTDDSQDVEGTGTPAVADGEAWLFVTGPVKVVRGPKFFTPDRDDTEAAVDRLMNDVTVFAERNYGFQYECGIAAIRVLSRSAYS